MGEIVQNKESGSQGESRRLSLEGFLRSAPSLLKVKKALGPRPGVRARVKAEIDLSTHSSGLGNSRPNVCRHVRGQNVQQ